MCCLYFPCGNNPHFFNIFYFKTDTKYDIILYHDTIVMIFVQMSCTSGLRQYRTKIVPQMRRRRACAPVLVLVTIIIPTDNIFLKLHWHRQLAGRQNVQNERS